MRLVHTAPSKELARSAMWSTCLPTIEVSNFVKVLRACQVGLYAFSPALRIIVWAEISMQYDRFHDRWLSSDTDNLVLLVRYVADDGES